MKINQKGKSLIKNNNNANTLMNKYERGKDSRN